MFHSTKITLIALAMSSVLCITSAACTADDKQFCMTKVTLATCAVKAGGTNDNCKWLQPQDGSSCYSKGCNTANDPCGSNNLCEVKRCKVKAGGTNVNCAKAFPYQQSCTIASGTDPKLPPKLPLDDNVNLCAVKAGGTNPSCKEATTKAMCTSAAINKKFVSCAVKVGGTNPTCASKEVTSVAACNIASTYNGVSGAANVCEPKTTDVGTANVCVYTDKNECIYTGYTKSACTAKSTAGGVSGDANACVFTASSETTISQKLNCAQVRIPTCTVKAGGKNTHCAKIKLSLAYLSVDVVKMGADCKAASTSGGISGAANVCEYTTPPKPNSYTGYSCYESCAVKAGGTNPYCSAALVTSVAACKTASTYNGVSGAANACEWTKHAGKVWKVRFFDLFGVMFFMFLCFYFFLCIHTSETDNSFILMYFVLTGTIHRC